MQQPAPVDSADVTDEQITAYITPHRAGREHDRPELINLSLRPPKIQEAAMAIHRKPSSRLITVVEQAG